MRPCANVNVSVKQWGIVFVITLCSKHCPFTAAATEVIAQKTNDQHHPQPSLVYSKSGHFVSGRGNIHPPSATMCVLNGVFRNVTRHSLKTLTSVMLSVSGIQSPRDLESESSQEDPL